MAEIIRKFSGGGSESQVLLITTPRGLAVRKHGTGRAAEKLKQQYEWLRQHQAYPAFPKVISDSEKNGSYSYDMEFYEHAVPLKELILKSPEDAFAPIKNMVDFFFANIYMQKMQRTAPDTFKTYIEEKILKKLETTAAFCPEIKDFLDYPEVIVNGRKYQNIKPLLNELLNDVQLKECLSQFTESAVHGNLTVENLLVNNGEIVALDPNNENIICDPLLDMANLYQSLHSGYEYIPEIKNLVVSRNRVEFEENWPEQYTAVFSMLHEYIFSRHFTAADDHAKLIFHEAVHYTRLLPYKMKLHRPLIICYLSKAILLLNESLELLKHGRTSA